MDNGIWVDPGHVFVGQGKDVQVVPEEKDQSFLD